MCFLGAFMVVWNEDEFSDDFDRAKSLRIKLERGIDFVEAREIWKDQSSITNDARYLGEQRYSTVGKMNNKLWVVIWTLRLKKIRIISVRRAEKTYFERKYNERQEK